MPYTFIFLVVFLDLVIRIHPWKKIFIWPHQSRRSPPSLPAKTKPAALGPQAASAMGPLVCWRSGVVLAFWCPLAIERSIVETIFPRMANQKFIKTYQKICENAETTSHPDPPDSPWRANEALDIAEPNSPGSQFQLSQPRETNGKNSKIWKESTVRKEKQRETAALMIFRTTRSALMINDSINGRVMPGPLSFQVSTTEKKGSLAWIESARACDGDLTGQDSGCPLVMV